MNPVWLIKNVRQVFRVCPRWRDRMEMLLWIYGSKLPAFLNARTHTFSCRYPAPVGTIEVTVRSNNGSDAFVFGEVFDHRYYDFDLALRPKTILDVGANVGLTAVFFARKYPHAELACVEPMPRNVDLLRDNMRRNGISGCVFAAAASIEDGPIMMQEAANDYGHKVADIEFGKMLKGEGTQVPGLSVRTIMSKLSWSRIGLLKLDIEGYEGVLLRTNCGWLSMVDAMAIECHEGFGEVDLREIAEKWGFLSTRKLAGVWLLEREIAM